MIPIPYVQIPKDLSKIKPKVAFGLTLRQLVCFGAAAALGLPVFFAVKSAAGGSAAALCMIAIMIPVLIFALYEHHGQPMEVFLRQFVQARWIRPPIRPYRTDNSYAALARQIQLNKEVMQIVRISAKEQKERKQNRKQAPDARAAAQNRRGAAGSPPKRRRSPHGAAEHSL